MQLPNYQNGSIVNLMSSLLRATGSTSRYAPLPHLAPSTLSECKNIILLIIDGFGYEFLQRYGEGTLWQQHLRQPITSVFPSTTAAGIMTFWSGLAPQQHGLTGWFMHLKEFGAVSTVLRFQPRCCPMSLGHESHLTPAVLLTYPTVFEQVRRQVYVVEPKALAASEYRPLAEKHAGVRYFTTLRGCFRQIKKLFTDDHSAKFMYVYWGELDSLGHEHGTHSTEVQTHFRDLTQQLTRFVNALKGSDTTLIITADHGMIDTEPAKTIQVQNHPQLRDTLILPLCGEPRAAYCYVRPSKTAQFEAYVQQHFDGMCQLRRSEDVIAEQYFGLFEPHPLLFDRVGDYVLLMQDNYIIKDYLLGDEQKVHIGNHGGVSTAEMLVPLVVIEL